MAKMLIQVLKPKKGSPPKAFNNVKILPKKKKVSRDQTQSILIINNMWRKGAQICRCTEAEPNTIHINKCHGEKEYKYVETQKQNQTQSQSMLENKMDVKLPCRQVSSLIDFQS